MNVAYLLVGTAWLAGQTPPATTNPAPTVQAAPLVSPGAGGIVAPGGGGIIAPGGGGCGCGAAGYDGCGGTDGCCGGGGWGHHFRNRMRGLFSRGGHHGSSGCCDSCAPVSTGCCSAPVSTSCGCDSGCGGGGGGFCHHFRNKMRGLFSRGGHHGSSGCCATDCGCGSGYGGYGSSGGCGGCGGCGGAPFGGTPYGAAPGGIYNLPGGAQGGERIGPPKDGGANKMPNGDKNGEGDKGGDKGTDKGGDKGGETSSIRPGQVQINVAPASAPTIEVAPAVGPAPALNDSRNKGPRDF